MPQDKLIIFDTTLRDGEQAPGIALTPDEKLAIARQLAKLRVDVIEAGFAAASDGDFYGVEQIAKLVEGPVIASLARCAPDDIDRAYDAVRSAARRRIHGGRRVGFNRRRGRGFSGRAGVRNAAAGGRGQNGGGQHQRRQPFAVNGGGRCGGFHEAVFYGRNVCRLRGRKTCSTN